MPAALKSRAGLGETLLQFSTPKTVRKTAFIPAKAKIFDRQRKAVDFFMVVSRYRFCLY